MISIDQGGEGVPLKNEDCLPPEIALQHQVILLQLTAFVRVLTISEVSRGPIWTIDLADVNWEK
jgi:hypothetical protein